MARAKPGRDPGPIVLHVSTLDPLLTGSPVPRGQGRLADGPPPLPSGNGPHGALCCLVQRPLLVPGFEGHFHVLSLAVPYWWGPAGCEQESGKPSVPAAALLWPLSQHLQEPVSMETLAACPAAADTGVRCLLGRCWKSLLSLRIVSPRVPSAGRWAPRMS